MSRIHNIDTTEEVRRLNLDIQRLGRGSLHHMLNNIERMGIVDSGRSFKKLRVDYRKNYGEIDRVSFKMDRYTLLQEYGVGRGWPIERLAHNEIADIESGKKRKPRPFISKVLDVMVPKMGDAVAKHKADAAVKAAFYNKNDKIIIGK